jgi:hypothetical protein
MSAVELSGACAQCLKDDVPGNGFVASQLEQFLKEQTTERGRSQFADARGLAKKTYVQGEKLICRACVMEARDASESAASREWSESPQLDVSFASRPFDLVCCNSAFGYVVQKVCSETRESESEAQQVQPGWRIVAISGVDMRGEPQAVVTCCLDEAELPVVIKFEQPVQPWATCSGCNQGSPDTTLSPSGKCTACQASFFDQTQDTEVADSWEDF